MIGVVLSCDMRAKKLRVKMNILGPRRVVARYAQFNILIEKRVQPMRKLRRFWQLFADWRRKLTFWSHADIHALSQSTALTFSSHIHVDITVTTIFTVVDCLSCYASPKKA